MIHELPLERRTLHGHFSRELAPVLSVDPGDSVHFSVPSARWLLDDRTAFSPRTSPEDDGHALAGPIAIRGALFSAGDGHAAQGDGEVSGTGLECPVAAALTLELRDDLELEWPIARIDGAWLTFGFDASLARAAAIALDGMLDLLEREHALARDDALALASVVCDLRVTQLANEQVGVHALLRDDALS